MPIEVENVINLADYVDSFENPISENYTGFVFSKNIVDTANTTECSVLVLKNGKLDNTLGPAVFTANPKNLAEEIKNIDLKGPKCRFFLEGVEYSYNDWLYHVTVDNLVKSSNGNIKKNENGLLVQDRLIEKENYSTFVEFIKETGEIGAKDPSLNQIKGFETLKEAVDEKYTGLALIGRRLGGPITHAQMMRNGSSVGLPGLILSSKDRFQKTKTFKVGDIEFKINADSLLVDSDSNFSSNVKDYYYHFDDETKIETLTLFDGHNRVSNLSGPASIRIINGYHDKKYFIGGVQVERSLFEKLNSYGLDKHKTVKVLYKESNENTIGNEPCVVLMINNFTLKEVRFYGENNLLHNEEGPAVIDLEHNVEKYYWKGIELPTKQVFETVKKIHKANSKVHVQYHGFSGDLTVEEFVLFSKDPMLVPKIRDYVKENQKKASEQVKPSPKKGGLLYEMANRITEEIDKELIQEMMAEVKEVNIVNKTNFKEQKKFDVNEFANFFGHSAFSFYPTMVNRKGFDLFDTPKYIIQNIAKINSGPRVFYTNQGHNEGSCLLVCKNKTFTIYVKEGKTFYHTAIWGDNGEMKSYDWTTENIFRGQLKKTLDDYYDEYVAKPQKQKIETKTAVEEVKREDKVLFKDIDTERQLRYLVDEFQDNYETIKIEDRLSSYKGKFEINHFISDSVAEEISKAKETKKTGNIVFTFKDSPCAAITLKNGKPHSITGCAVATPDGYRFFVDGVQYAFGAYYDLDITNLKLNAEREIERKEMLQRGLTKRIKGLLTSTAIDLLSENSDAGSKSTIIKMLKSPIGNGMLSIVLGSAAQVVSGQIPRKYAHYVNAAAKELRISGGADIVYEFSGEIMDSVTGKIKEEFDKIKTHDAANTKLRIELDKTPAQAVLSEGVGLESETNTPASKLELK